MGSYQGLHSLVCDRVAVVFFDGLYVRIKNPNSERSRALSKTEV